MCSSGSTRCSWKFVFRGRFLLSFFLMQCERSDVANYTHEARGWSEKDRWCPRTKKNSASRFSDGREIWKRRQVHPKKTYRFKPAQRVKKYADAHCSFRTSNQTQLTRQNAQHTLTLITARNQGRCQKIPCLVLTTHQQAHSPPAQRLCAYLAADRFLQKRCSSTKTRIRSVQRFRVYNNRAPKRSIASPLSFFSSKNPTNVSPASAETLRLWRERQIYSGSEFTSPKKKKLGETLETCLCRLTRVEATKLRLGGAKQESILVTVM